MLAAAVGLIFKDYCFFNIYCFEHKGFAAVYTAGAVVYADFLAIHIVNGQ